MTDYHVDIRVLSKAEVESLVSYRDVVDTVEETFLALARHEIFHPIKEPIWVDDGRANMIMAMAAHIKSQQVAGVKWVNMYENQQPGYPSCAGSILLLNDDRNGQPYAILEATSITAMRTAGGHAAVAAKHLARPDSQVLTVIGCGTEAVSGVASFLDLFALRELRVFDIHPAAMQRMRELYGDRLTVTCCSDAQTACEGADILMTVTTSRRPVVEAGWIPKGCFVAGLYSLFDLDPKAAITCDKWVLGSKEADRRQILEDPVFEDYHLTMENVYADLPEILSGAKPGRERDDETIVYTHFGMGALDVAVGKLIYQRACAQDVGQIIRLV
ncbi:ornithine cyclodeaminase family protein [Anaerotruncus rubiinfantis]|uniref:ornithine cyclodeaminase family protein n=1 Tax=Anaerotruncus rubiinfantis TaxID=1720200 RepID=UPI00082ACFA1|nr:ornithine cyclodeaminase family protein [Anaerotruncus rubiinfantis]